MTAEPADRFYESQGLRLHYVDWGNDAAPPLILVHGGLDHCRNWDAIARELQPHFHVMAPDLRGHGDSEWARGSSYTLVDNVADLTRLIAVAGLKDAATKLALLSGSLSAAPAIALHSRSKHTTCVPLADRFSASVSSVSSTLMPASFIM